MTGIYYGDLFIINEKGCVVFGHGKSKTCRNYTGSDTKEIVTDSLRFEEGEKLVAYGDPGMGYFPVTANNPHLEVDYFIYMYGEDECQDTKIKKFIFKNKFIKTSLLNIFFGVEDEDRPSRLKEFKSLLKNHPEIKLIGVPWQENMEIKGKLIKEYIK